MWKWLVVFILCISFAPLHANGEGRDITTSSMKVYFLDVGQGDSILLYTPNGKWMLVDGGPPEHGGMLVQKLKSYGVKQLDYIVATHPDIDHIGGLVEVLQQFSVGVILDSGKKYDSFTYYTYLKSIDSKKVPFKTAKEGAFIPLDPMVNIRILNNGELKRENNESSVILKVSFGKADFLLTGDADVEIEERISQKYDLQAEVLKVGHHGSYTSTSMEFLNHVNPVYAVLTYEKGNDYHHPHGRVVKRLKKKGIKMLSTAKYGDVIFETDGLYLKVNGETTYQIP